MPIKKVLVVDDSPTERYFLTELLTKNGFQLTRQLSKDPVTQHIPVIMCTSKNLQTDRIWGLRQGARDYVTKPVKVDELLEKISALG